MALVYVVHLLGRGQLGPEQAEAWREARVEDHRRAPLQLHPAVRRGHRRLDLVRVRLRVRVRVRVRVGVGVGVRVRPLRSSRPSTSRRIWAGNSARRCRGASWEAVRVRAQG